MMGLQLTLRELQRQIFDPRVLVIWALAILVAVMSGPFGTDATPLWFRALYWGGSISAAVVMSIGIIGLVMSAPRFNWIDARVRPVLGALAFAAVYALFLTGLDIVVFKGETGMGGYVGYFITTASIAVGISIAVAIFIAVEGKAAVTTADAPPPDDRFFKRLKPELGRTLIRLAMQDHYLEVHTDKGSQLILMRFSDALGEIEGAEGWRIHRSHWIAEAAIRGVRRENGRTILIASDGAELPVSRTYLPALRAAGVLKRFA